VALKLSPGLAKAEIMGLFKRLRQTKKKCVRRKAGALAFGTKIKRSVVHVVRDNPFNIRARDADVGEFAIAQMRQLPPNGAGARPGVQETANGCKHGLRPFPGEGLGKSLNRGANIGSDVRCTIDYVAAQLRTGRMARGLNGKEILKLRRTPS
jgi:hypothetical protein